MSTDDLRTRVARAFWDFDQSSPTVPGRAIPFERAGEHWRSYWLEQADRAIAVVWNEAHRAGFNEAIEAGRALMQERGDCYWNRQRRESFLEAVELLNTLRKLEEGVTPADLAAETGYDPGRDM